jgi:hypothetical protein
MKAVIIALTAALALSAGAKADPPGPPQGPPGTPANHGPPPAGPLARTFISPSGEPFRPSLAAPDPFEAWFAQVDANHDGVIDRAEFRADALRFFKRLDTNGDGVIDGFEINNYESRIAPELAAEAEGRFADDGPGGGGHGRGGRHGEGQNTGRGFAQILGEPEPVSGADYDLDGKVSLADWMKATDARFDLLDTGKTGQLTHEQLKAKLLKLEAKKR